MPKGFFPQQDTGRLIGGIQADQSISFQAMQQKLAQMMRDRAARSGGADRGRLHRRRGGAGATNTGIVFVALKPLAQRHRSIDQVMARLRRELAHGAGRAAVPAAGAGHPRRRPAEQRRSISTRCRATATAELYEWAPKLLTALEHDPMLADVNSDQQQKGLETDLIDRPRHRRRLG